MLDSILGFGLVAMFPVSLCQPDVGFLLWRIKRFGFLETVDGFGDVSAEHFRSHQALPAEAGPHARILVVERHRLGIFLFHFWTKLRSQEHRAPQRDLSAVKIRKQAMCIG